MSREQGQTQATCPTTSPEFLIQNFVYILYFAPFKIFKKFLEYFKTSCIFYIFFLKKNSLDPLLNDREEVSLPLSLSLNKNPQFFA